MTDQAVAGEGLEKWPGPGRVRYLVEGEWPKLEEAAKAGPWWLYPACMLVRYAGLRRGEVRRLKWSDVDLDNALIRIQNTKGNRNEVIPLSSCLSPQYLRDAVEAISNGRGGEVVPKKSEDA